MPRAPFFIVGCPRSGTSLVSQLLDSHSRLAVFHETQYYPVFRPHLASYGDLARPANSARLIADLRAWLRLQDIDPPGPSELAAPTFEGVLAALLQSHAERQGKARGGDKTPEHHEFLAEIRAGLPDSPLIFVMRDPRDTVRSFRKAFGATTDGSVRAWNRAFASYRRHADQVHLVRYEQLVADPAATLTATCALLGERYEPQMLRFFERVPERLRSLPNVELLASPIDPSAVGRFRELPPKEIREIESGCAEGMEALGYEFSQPRAARAPAPPEPPRRAAVVVERLRYYWGRPDRRRFGWFRWKIMLRARLRHLLAGWSR